MAVRRLRWARFSLGHLLFLVLGIALGIACEDYLTSFANIRARQELHSFTIAGAVACPGEYNFVDKSLPLMEAIARAGGMNRDAGQLKLTRQGADGAQDVTVIDLQAATGEAISPGDVVEILVSGTESVDSGTERHSF